MDCGAWNANMSVDPSSSTGSLALSLSWTAAPAACTNPSAPDWNGVDHYRIYRRDGAAYDSSSSCSETTTSFASSSPTGGEFVANVSGATTWTDYVHRSAKDFRYAVVACHDASCSRIYGGAGGESVASGSDEDSDCTEREQWVVWSVTSRDPSTWSGSVDWVEATANASAALFYPADFVDDSSTSIEGHLGFWWSDGSACGKSDCIYYKRAASAGLQDWNSSPTWTATSSDPVAEETGGSGDYSDLSHPWVAASEVSGTRSILMWMRRSSSDCVDNHTVLVESTDEAGADFGLECSSGCDDSCAAGEFCDYSSAQVDVCADGTSSCSYLAGARHGRLMWNYIASPTLDLSSDTPSMVVTGAPDEWIEEVCGDTGWTSTCAMPGDATDPSQDDLYRVDWDGSAWDVAMDSGCPDPQASFDGTDGDMHDPGILPLPDSEFKMYALRGEDEFLVSYWNGSDWEDTTNVLVALDDGSHGAGDDVSVCVQNVDAWVLPGSPPVEGMFFHARAYNSDPACFGGPPEDLGILYARHIN